MPIRLAHLLAPLNPPIQSAVTCSSSTANFDRDLDSPVANREPQCSAGFKALIAEKERFFTLFEKHAAIIVRGAEALRGLLQGGDTVQDYCKQIFQREAEADDVTREVLRAVRRTLSPLRSDDIQDLITSMDDAIDQMTRPQRPLSYSRSEVSTADAADERNHPSIGESGAGSRAALELELAATQAASMLSPPSSSLSRKKADDIYNRGLKALFYRQSSGRQPRQRDENSLLARSFYDHLEKVVDRFEDCCQ